MRFHGLLLGFFGVFLLSSPAQAGKLTSWQFVPNQNRLTFTTNDGVQPQAQLLTNPTRLVIDLPETTLESQTVKENYGETFKNLRVGQFENQTTRLVLELAPGYTLDPEKIEFQGNSSRNWSVNLPEPTRDSLAQATPSSLNSSPTSLTVPTSDRNSQNGLADNSLGASSSYLKVTRNGIFVNLKGNNTNKVKVSRSDDRNTIELELENVILPQDLANQTIPVNSYGIDTIQFLQASSSPATTRLSLRVNQDSPDWIASFSRFGGLVIVPKGGMGSISTSVASNPNPPSSIPLSVPPASSSSSSDRLNGSSFRDRLNGSNSSDRLSRFDRLKDSNSSNRISRFDRLNGSSFRDRLSRGEGATIESVQLQNNGQLTIKADQMVMADGKWNSIGGVYEIRIPNAKLADSFQGPQFEVNSPISELRVRQEDNAIVLLMRPALGVRFGELAQLDDNMLSLEVQQRLTAQAPLGMDVLIPPAGANTPPLSERPLLFPKDSSSSSLSDRNRRGGLLIVIDPGHGGKDPGAIGRGGLQEKEIVLDISQQINKILDKQGLKVMLTRSTDEFISLEGRTQIANRAGADLFVSIHANSINLSRPDVNGLQNYYYKNGKKLAETVHRNVLRSVNIQDRGVHKARFYVLRHSDMPSVLVELGYVTGANDAAKLKDPSFRRQMAEAIARGIIEYIQRDR